MSLVIINELLVKLSTEDPRLPQRFPAIPWRAIRGLRNRIVHDYYSINLDIIFDTAKHGLPELLDMLKDAGLDDPSPDDVHPNGCGS